MSFTPENLARWRSSPSAFIEEVLVDPETGEPFALNRAQRRFLARAFQLTPDGRLRFPEMVFSCPKKSGKTGFAGMITIYVVLVLGGRFAEGYLIANDFEQAQGRVFQAVRRIIAVSPMLVDEAVITASRIEFRATGATITAIASDFAGAAGANPTITVFDELWGVTTERGHRLWDEMVPPPTRKIACRLTVTYAGFEGESALLESLYKRGMAGEQVEPDLWEAGGLLMFWTHDFIAPWQTEAWRDQMRAQLRTNGYLRLIENRWVSAESTFIDMALWDACVDTGVSPILADRRMPIWVGVDASVRRDSTAIVAVTWDVATQKVRLIAHRIFHPSPDDPLDFEATVEATLLDLAGRFAVREIRYDPFQMQAPAQRLAARRLPMVEFAQTTANLTASSTGLFEVVMGRNLVAYPDAEIRLAMQRSVAIETGRGWRIAKEKTAHKIDVVVALAMAAHGAVRESTAAPNLWAASDLLIDGELPAPLPRSCQTIFGVLVADRVGHAAITYWMFDEAQQRGVGTPLLLIDFETAPLRGNLIDRAIARIEDLHRETKVRAPWASCLWVPQLLLQQVQLRGFDADTIPESLLKDLPGLAMAAAGFIDANMVKLCAVAFEQIKHHPLGISVMSLRSGDALDDDPLRLSYLCGVALALTPNAPTASPALPAARVVAA